MTNPAVDVEFITSMLHGINMPEQCGVSFVGKGLKLNNADDAQAIVTELNNSEKVEFLNMEGNSLGVDAAKEIAKALENRKEFKRALWKDMFTSRLKTEIPVALKYLTGGLMLAGAKVEVLDLSDNASGPIGVEGFEDFLRSPSCYSLRELRLNNMGLGVTGAKKLASALMDLYNNSKNAGEPLKLEVFVAGRNRLENVGAIALAQVFQKIGTLKEVSIPQNGIYHVGISALSAAFKENILLEIINLNDNTLTKKGALALSKALSCLTNLKLLDLGDCLLRSKGALIIAESLSPLTSLESLNLSSNEIKGEAAMTILKSLSSLSSCLKFLNMNENLFGPVLSEKVSDCALDLQLPFESVGDDEGSDGDQDEEDSDKEEEEEDDDDDDDDDEEDLEDSESDQPYNIDEEYDDEETDGETTVLSSGVSPMRNSSLPQPILLQMEGNKVTNFVLKATKDNFNLIANPKAENIIKDVKKRLQDVESRCEELIRIIVLVAGLHACNDQNIKEIVMRTCITLFQEITLLTETSKATHILNNRLPVHFGYLKDEETNKKKAVVERESCLRVLHAAIDSKCLPQQTINIITSIESCIAV